MKTANNNEKKPRRQLNKYAHFTGIAFQLGATIFLAAYVGDWLDQYFQMKEKIFTLILILLGLVGTIWSITIQLKNIDKD